MTTDTERRIARLGTQFTEEQTIAASVARTFATWRLATRASERDRASQFPVEEVAALAELGFLAMKVPSELGGGGIDNVGYVLAMEAIAEACASTAVVLASSNLVASLLAQGGHGRSGPGGVRRFLHRARQAGARVRPGGGQDGPARVRHRRASLR